MRDLFKSKKEVSRTFLSREAILKAQLRKKEIFVPELGGWIRFREMSADEIGELKQDVIGRDGQMDPRKIRQMDVQTFSKYVIDENGQPMFTTDDVKELKRVSGNVVKRVAAEIGALSGIGESEEDSITAWLGENYPGILEEYQNSQDPIKQAEENFTPTPTGASLSD